MTTEPDTAAAVESALLAFCRENALLKAGDTVIAACSGGADSMALLLFLLRRGGELGVTVKAAHVDHGIRGEASRRDAGFVAAFCRQNGIELLLYDAAADGVNIPEHPSEDWARRLRYGWFDRLAAQHGAKIATAHTRNDQAETLLFRLARGTSVHGMAGIAPHRGPYVRPCLCLTRAQTEAYCRALGQSYVQDATNEDVRYARNRIRHQALPALCEVNPAAVAALDRFAAQMRVLDSYLTAQAAALLDSAAAGDGYDLEKLRRAPEPVLQAAAARLLSEVAQPSCAQVGALCALVQNGSGAIQVSPGAVFCVQMGILLCRCTPPPLPQPLPPQPAQPGTYLLSGGYELELQVLPIQKYEKFIKNVVKSKKDLNCCADYAKIGKNLWLRTRQPGDRFAPAGRACHKTLKKYLNELAVPPEQRSLLPLLACGNEVLWLWGSGFAAGLAPGPGTESVLIVRCLKDLAPQGREAEGAYYGYDGQ